MPRHITNTSPIAILAKKNGGMTALAKSLSVPRCLLHRWEKNFTTVRPTPAHTTAHGELQAMLQADSELMQETNAAEPMAEAV